MPNDARRVTVAKHDSDSGRWALALGAPHPLLRDDVSRYCCYSESETRFTRRREMPTGEVVVIINLGSPLRIYRPQGDTFAFGASSGFLAGLDETYVLSETKGNQRGVQIGLTPIGAYRILGLPMYLVTNRMINLEDLFGSEARRLIEQLQDATDHERRFALLDAALLARISRSRPPSPIAAQAWRRLVRTAGQANIGALAVELDCSRKHLASKFHEQVGLAPKSLAKLLRFNHVIRRLRAGETGWAELADRCGFYDQAHFIRDFRRFTGYTPSAFVGRLLPDSGGIVED